MRTLFSVIFCLLLAAPLVNAAPPNPTDSDGDGNTAGGTDALGDNMGSQNTAFGFSALGSHPWG
jgi:hypothetical protein